MKTKSVGKAETMQSGIKRIIRHLEREADRLKASAQSRSSVGGQTSDGKSVGRQLHDMFVECGALLQEAWGIGAFAGDVTLGTIVKAAAKTKARLVKAGWRDASDEADQELFLAVEQRWLPERYPELAGRRLRKLKRNGCCLDYYARIIELLVDHLRQMIDAMPVFEKGQMQCATNHETSKLKSELPTIGADQQKISQSEDSFLDRTESHVNLQQRINNQGYPVFLHKRYTKVIGNTADIRATLFPNTSEVRLSENLSLKELASVLWNEKRNHKTPDRILDFGGIQRGRETWQINLAFLSEDQLERLVEYQRNRARSAKN